MNGIGTAQPARDFDAAKWLADWSANGGLYVLADDRVYLRRLGPVDYVASQQLDRLRDEMVRAGGGPEVAVVLMRRRQGLAA